MPSPRKRLALGLGLGLAATALVAGPSPANPTGTGLVIGEVYGGGGNAGAPVNADFVEILNPTSGPLSLAGLSLQGRAATGGSAGAVLSLSGSVPAGGRFLVQTSPAGANGAALPTPDATVSWTLGAAGAQVLLVSGTTAFTGSGDLAGNAGLVDMVGWGTTSGGSPATSFETARGATTGNTTSLARPGADTDNNSVDFVVGAPTPQGSGGGTTPPEPTITSIAEIQGTGESSPMSGQTVTTEGVVTAAYLTGGLNGFHLQTGGTGGPNDTTPGASDGLFVFGQNVDESTLAVGDSLRVTGRVSEFNGSTQIAPASAADVVDLATPLAPVLSQPVLPGSDCALPGDDCLTGSALEAIREAHEAELFRPSGPTTVSDSYDGSPWAGSPSSFFGEIGLAVESDGPLVQPTELYPVTDEEAIAQRLAWNEAHRITLDDGATTNYSSSRNLPFPWLTPTNTVRVGAAVEFRKPAVLTKAFGQWRLQPTAQVTDAGTTHVGFEQDRPAAPEPVGGDLQLATFNVLNYFPTTGEEFEASGLGTCSYFTDRDGDRTTVRTCTTTAGGPGPRGAADEENLLRQQAKTVAAINGLDADIVSLEELENSAKFGKDRDFAIRHLVTALNEAAGAGTWSYVPSPQPSQRPEVADEDVIRTGFIYRTATVKPAGRSQILRDQVNFDNAREPLAQVFKPAGSNAPGFTVVVNHLKSKGCPADGTEENAETIQGCWNGDRVRQAEAVAAFADRFAAEHGTEAVFLVGDFNSYSQEDPMLKLHQLGYTAVESDTEGEETYSFSGLAGSLDHVLANDAALATVTGADIWNISSGEAVYYEYSRYDANATNLYAPDQYRSSDHDPELVGLDLP